MKSGLEDIFAAETKLSDVDGAAGRLIIRVCRWTIGRDQPLSEDVAARCCWTGCSRNMPMPRASGRTGCRERRAVCACQSGRCGLG